MSKHNKRKQSKKYTKSDDSSYSNSSDDEDDRKRSKYVSSDSSNDSADSPRSKSRSPRENSKRHKQKHRQSYSDSEVEEASRSKSPHNEKGRSRSRHGHHHHHHHRESSEDVPASYKQSNSNYLERHKHSDHNRSSNQKKFHQDGNYRSSKSNDSGADRFHHDNRDNKYRSRREESPQRRNSRDRHIRRRRRSNSFDHANAKWGKTDSKEENKDTKDAKEKEKPNFALSGKLTEETNTYRGVVIKYSEPPEARKPKRRWRLYPFKGEKALQTLYIHRESGYLIGRERKVVDIPVDHPSCSKQHAALQYRLVTFTRDDGTTGKRVRPYLIDLDSANGTYINNKKIDPRKYVELLEKDVIKFGYSSREYVLLHENSKDEAQDDDVKDEFDEVAVKKEH